MVSVIIIYSKKLKINPDNVATPLAGKFFKDIIYMI